MTEDEIIVMARALYQGLQRLTGMGNALSPSEPMVVEDPRKSIKEKTVTCMECGKGLRIITGRHFASHGLTTVT